MTTPKRPRGRPASGRKQLTVSILPETLAILRGHARAMARERGNKRLPIGAAIDALVRTQKKA